MTSLMLSSLRSAARFAASQTFCSTRKFRITFGIFGTPPL